MLSSTATAMAPDILDQCYDEGVDLILCSGKGGVGKTTLAASLSLRFADRYPQHRVLVVSTDPAHSLGDCLEMAPGSEPRPINGSNNLWAAETQRLVEALKRLHVPLGGIFINRLIQSGNGCRYCTAKMGEQRSQVARYRMLFPSLDLIQAPYFPRFGSPSELLVFAS